MGSRTVDFFNTPLTDHGIESLFLRPIDEIEDDYDHYHDYAHNATSIHLCDIIDIISSNDNSIQTSSPGIMLIVEAEDATVDLAKSSELKTILTGALAKEGLAVVSAETTESSDGNIIVSIVLREGYVIARAMPELKYCGFDIHLWSSFDKQEGAKKALVAAVGSKGSHLTSYRVIAGGMFGAPTWKLDMKNNGPQFDEMCKQFVKKSDDDTVTKMGDAKQSIIDTALVEGIKLLEAKDVKVAMLIGNVANRVAENNRKVLESIDSVNQVVPLNCPSMVDFNEFSDDAPEALTLCEKHLLATLKDLSSEEAFDVVVIDSTADRFTASILLKVFVVHQKSRQPQFLVEDALVLSVLVDESDDWRKHVLLLMKDDVFQDEPACFIEILFENDDSAFKLLLANDGDFNFIQKVNNTVPVLADKSGMKVSVESISGGMW